MDVPDYDTRRCYVCGITPAHLGFGPPLNPKGMIFACSAHQAEVYRLLVDLQGGLSPHPGSTLT